MEQHVGFGWTGGAAVPMKGKNVEPTVIVKIPHRGTPGGHGQCDSDFGRNISELALRVPPIESAGTSPGFGVATHEKLQLTVVIKVRPDALAPRRLGEADTAREGEKAATVILMKSRQALVVFRPKVEVPIVVHIASDAAFAPLPRRMFNGPRLNELQDDQPGPGDWLWIAQSDLERLRHLANAGGRLTCLE